MISTLFQSISWPKLLAWSLTEDCLFPVRPCLCSFNLVFKSYEDLVARLEPVIMELERQENEMK